MGSMWGSLWAAAWHAVLEAPRTTTTVLLAVYAIVLLRIVLLARRVLVLRRRLHAPSAPTGSGLAAPAAKPPARLSHKRSNLYELSSMARTDVTDRERAEYAELCASMVRDAMAAVRSDGGGDISWQPRGRVDGAECFLAHTDASPVVLIKGVTTLPIPSIDTVAAHFAALTTTDAMRHALAKVDPMFQDGRVLLTLPPESAEVQGEGARAQRASEPAGAAHVSPGASAAKARAGGGGAAATQGEPAVATPPSAAPRPPRRLSSPEPAAAGRPPAGKTQVEWACFRAPPPLAPRDFCWLEHSAHALAPDGRRAFLSICSSVEREEAPDMWQTHGYVRGRVFAAGYVFVETDEPGLWQLNYVVQLDPMGIIPKWIVNLVATDQAANAAALRAALLERLDAEELLGGAAPTAAPAPTAALAPNVALAPTAARTPAGPVAGAAAAAATAPTPRPTLATPAAPTPRAATPLTAPRAGAAVGKLGGASGSAPSPPSTPQPQSPGGGDGYLGAHLHEALLTVDGGGVAQAHVGWREAGELLRCRFLVQDWAGGAGGGAGGAVGAGGAAAAPAGMSARASAAAAGMAASAWRAARGAAGRRPATGAGPPAADAALPALPVSCVLLCDPTAAPPAHAASASADGGADVSPAEPRTPGGAAQSDGGGGPSESLVAVPLEIAISRRTVARLDGRLGEYLLCELTARAPAHGCYYLRWSKQPSMYERFTATWAGTRPTTLFYQTARSAGGRSRRGSRARRHSWSRSPSAPASPVPPSATPPRSLA